MRPTIDAALIAQLKGLVVEHNEAHPDAKTKLGDLRKIYERNFRRTNPGARALQKVEQHLQDLAKGIFDESEHPRDHGEFAPKGSLREAQAAHHARQATDPEYRALTSDVVPDNRHEATGALIRNGVAVGGTAAALGTLAASQKDGRLARKAGELGGKKLGRVGRKLAQGGVNTLIGATHGLLRVKPGSRGLTLARKAGAFGVLSLAGGMAVRSQWKDSFLDPAVLGRSMDAYSYRTIEKIAASAELGAARAVLTEGLAKSAGSPGGSMEDLRGWLEAGHGSRSEVEALAKGIPWSKAATRLFSAVAGVGGSAAGALAGYGSAKLTEPLPPEGGDFNSKHPRDDHGRFSVKANTSRAHRFAQVGGLLGGAAAAIATHRALSRFSGRNNLVNLAHLRAAYGDAVRRTQAFQSGEAAAAHKNGPARIEHLISRESDHPDFKKHRALLKEIDAMSPSDIGAIQAKVRKAYDQHLAEQLAEFGGMELPTAGGGWKTLRTSIKGQPKKIENTTAEEAEVMAALKRIHASKDPTELWKEMLKRMVANKTISAKQAETINGVRRQGLAAVAAVPRNMKGHEAKLKAAEKIAADAKNVLDGAKGRLDIAVTDTKLKGPTLDDEGKAGLEAAQAVAEQEHKNARKLFDAAARDAKQIRDNPVGVIHPIHKEPILPPTEGEIGLEQTSRRAKAMEIAHKAAKELVEKENNALRDRQLARLQRAYERRELVMVHGMARSYVPKRADAALASLVKLKAKAEGTAKSLKEAELEHLPHQQEMDRLTDALKETKRKDGSKGFKTPAGMSDAEADALRLREPEVRANFEKSRAAVGKAEAAHIKAVTDRTGALATFNNAMKELPPTPPRQLMDPELRAEVDRMRREIGTLAGNFMQTKSGQDLKALYEKVAADAKRHGKTGYAQGKKLGYKAFLDLFTRVDTTSPQGWRFDAGKIIQNVSFGTALATAARADLVTHAQRLLGNKDADHRKLRILPSQDLDPTLNGGQGYFALHMQDPHNPNERSVIFGHTFTDLNGATTPIPTGASLSGLQRALRDREEERKKAQKGNGNGQGQGQSHEPMPGMSDEDRKTARAAVNALAGKSALDTIPTSDGGPTITVRKEGWKPNDNEKELNATLSKGEQSVTTTLKNKHGLGSSTPSGGAIHSALAALFSDEAKLQRRNRKFMFLTGHTEDGQKTKDNASILSPDDGYGNQGAEAAASALATEIDRIVTKHPPANRAQATNLVRAIGLVAHVKKLDSSVTTPLYASVMQSIGHASAGPAAAAAEAPAATAAAPAVIETPKPALHVDLDTPSTIAQRKTWNRNVAARAAHDLADDINDALRIQNDAIRDNMPLALEGLAAKLHDLEPGFSETEAVGQVAATMKQLATTPQFASNVAKILRNPDVSDPGEALWIHMRPILTPKVERRRRDLGKSGDYLDDLEQLVKLSMGGAIGRFSEMLHPRAPSGAAGGGEFVAEGAGHAEAGGHGAAVSPGARVAGEAAEAGTLAARKLTGGNGGSSGTLPGEGPATRAPEQAWYNPVRFGNEYGGSLGFDAGLGLVHFLLPEASALTAGAGLAARALSSGKSLARMGAGLVAGSVAAEGASRAGEAAGSKAVSLATGRKAPEYQAPESHGAGSMLANAVGSTVGGIVGSTLGAVGGPVGSIAGGATLGYAAGKATEGIYDYFAGYDQASVKRAMARTGVTPRRVSPKVSPSATP